MGGRFKNLVGTSYLTKIDARHKDLQLSDAYNHPNWWSEKVTFSWVIWVNERDILWTKFINISFIKNERFWRIERESSKCWKCIFLLYYHVEMYICIRYTMPTIWGVCASSRYMLHWMHMSNTNIHFQNCTFPNPVPEGHKEALQLAFSPQVLAWYIQYQHIYTDV